ncbi:MAG: leucyl aminopeptidase [Roseivirga sp.]|jgi:leucyl aminopeptidase
MIFKSISFYNDSKVVILPFLKDQVDYDLIKHYTKSITKPDFEGSFKQIISLYHASEDIRVYLVGLGDAKDQGKAHDAFRWLTFKRKTYWKSNITVDCSHLSDNYITEAALGIALGDYRIGVFKTDEEELDMLHSKDFEVSILTKTDQSQLVNIGYQTAQSMMGIMALVDAPGNVKTPTFLAEWAQNSAENHGYSCDVLEYEELVEEGLEALMAVGQGSNNSPVLIKLEYKPANLNSETAMLGLVGKGITFDTGGLSIKPSQNMHYMKSDMGGAAAVFGAIELAARLQLPIHLVGIIASAENAVDANSVKPGDVIGSYSGKSIEIIDTDAEGRLVLADALSYMVRNYKPQYMIDLATLTGSSVMTLGYSAGAMFTHDDHMNDMVSKAGYSVHERVWRLPLFDDFKADIQSDLADVRNYSGKPLAGAITAAKFLEAFIEDHEHWMHLDIAGVAFGDNAYAKMKSASGYGVRLLYQVMSSLIENK